MTTPNISDKPPVEMTCADRLIASGAKLDESWNNYGQRTKLLLQSKKEQQIVQADMRKKLAAKLQKTAVTMRRKLMKIAPQFDCVLSDKVKLVLEHFPMPELQSGCSIYDKVFRVYLESLHRTSEGRTKIFADDIVFCVNSIGREDKTSLVYTVKHFRPDSSSHYSKTGQKAVASQYQHENYHFVLHKAAEILSDLAIKAESRFPDAGLWPLPEPAIATARTTTTTVYGSGSAATMSIQSPMFTASAPKVKANFWQSAPARSNYWVDEHRYDD